MKERERIFYGLPCERQHNGAETRFVASEVVRKMRITNFKRHVKWPQGTNY